MSLNPPDPSSMRRRPVRSRLVPSPNPTQSPPTNTHPASLAGVIPGAQQASPQGATPGAPHPQPPQQYATPPTPPPGTAFPPRPFLHHLLMDLVALGACVVILAGIALTIIGVVLAFSSRWQGVVGDLGTIASVLVTILVAIIVALVPFLKECFKSLWEDLSNDKIRALSLVLNIVLIIGILAWHFQWWPFSGPENEWACQGKGICIALMSGQPIGISTGQYRFWSGSDSNNAENKIYVENGNIGPRGYITIVVVTTLSPGSQELTGHDELQGAYEFQYWVDELCKLKDCEQVKLLVANAGNDLQYAGLVAQQVAYLKEHGEPIVGVAGMPVSTQGAIDGIRYLSEQGIPVVSSTESSDALPATPLYFRVAPLDSRQGAINAQFMRKNFPQVKRAAIFYPSDNPYGLTLATSFGNTFSANGGTLYYETFQRGDNLDQRKAQIADDLDYVASKDHPGPDMMIFCACYSDDLNSLLTLLHGRSEFQNNLVDSGDAAYDLGGYNQANTPSMNYENLFYSAFAFPDEWGTIDVRHCPPEGNRTFAQRFFCDYADDFDFSRKHLSDPYGYDRADSHVMLAYDAMMVLVTAYAVAKRVKGGEPGAVDIGKALLGGDGCGSFQGISGQITFSVDGSPVDKAVVMLYVNNSGTASMKGGGQGQLQVTQNQCKLQA